MPTSFITILKIVYMDMPTSMIWISVGYRVNSIRATHRLEVVNQKR